MAVTFESWVGARSISTLGTNAGADVLAFQSWRRFKEAFAPELVKRAVAECARPVRLCLDPFGGSGTTALACQFLGILPQTIEVNPYLADLIEAKLATYSLSSLSRDFASLVRAANHLQVDPNIYFASAPPTFVEPGINGRWIFDKPVAARLAAYCVALEQVQNSANSKLFRVLLGGILVNVSNVVVSGKGRRYRRGWQKECRSALDLDEAFCQAVESAIGDIVRFAERAELGHSVVRGDTRAVLSQLNSVDLIISSPPYPNSFDYTDVYNVELWGLRYLDSATANRTLRNSTLSSHVQLKREYVPPPNASPKLKRALLALQQRRHLLWDHSIPDMVGAYFAEMNRIISDAIALLNPGGELWLVVGDSQYAGVVIPVGEIVAELAVRSGCSLIRQEPFRSMRSSAQQGGEADLSEILLVLGPA